jgi:staphyloferrin B biosynthesis citrate synthase
MNGKELSQALRSGKRVYGTCAISTSPNWAGAIAGSGADFVFIDTEHTPIDRHQLAWMCGAYNALNCAPVVRIPEPDPYRACMVMDAGAMGVIAPYCETVEQVKALRGAVKWRPLKGKKLYDFLDGKEDLPPVTKEYLRSRNENRVMIVNVESVPALDALDDILAVPDIDALLVGPHDLSVNLGVPEQYDDSTFMDAISLIIHKARAANVGVGVHYSDGIEKHIGWAKEGVNFVVHSSDISIVRQTLIADFARFRQELGEAKVTAEGEEEVI